jgi:glucose/arabinose dehydrogenase/mono/diheme cytochrome c family protein
MKRTRLLFFYMLLVIIISCQAPLEEYKDIIYEKPEIVRDAPSDFLSPEESMETFYLPEGYKVELVASEPMINEPVAIAWDGDGKMYVAQMETYMQNVDGDGTDEPISKIMLLEDTDGDGKMDKSTVFIDSLLLPRMILPLDDRLLVNETYSYNITSYRDTDGDGVADEKTPMYVNPNRRGGNLEHQQSGLVWNLDNWIYTTYNPMRFRYTKGGLQVDTLDNMPSGQWGLTQDDLGHMYYSSAGGENPAYGFQQHPTYGNVNPEGRLSEGFIEPWPVVGTPDVQGGAERRLREDGTLNHFTGISGQEIYRGHTLPPDAYGDLFIPEPVGRLIRRAKVKNEKGKKVLYNAYDQKEFMASTDLNFRPVQAKTGPDGALYIVDMYRGIIQESNWTREGSLLRPVIVRKGLDKNFGKGRIYRIVHEQIKPDTNKPNLLDKTATELLDYLGHPNGWYRNTAQKLLIVKNDEAVIPKLKELARETKTFWNSLSGNTDFVLQRIHALWTLEGLGVMDESLLQEKFADEDVRVRITAIQLSDGFLKNGNVEILSHLEKLMFDSDINVVNQLALSLRSSQNAEATELLNAIAEKNADNDIITKSVFESLKKDDSELQKLKDRIAGQPTRFTRRILRGYDNYKQLCVTCHGADLKGAKNEDGSLIAPSLIGSPRVSGDKDVMAKILLNGLVGPVDGKDYGIMVPVGNNDDEWISDVISYVRSLNDASTLHPNDVRKVREETEDKEGYWTLKELGK